MSNSRPNHILFLIQPWNFWDQYGKESKCWEIGPTDMPKIPQVQFGSRISTGSWLFPTRSHWGIIIPHMNINKNIHLTYINIFFLNINIYIYILYTYLNTKKNTKTIQPEHFVFRSQSSNRSPLQRAPPKVLMRFTEPKRCWASLARCRVGKKSLKIQVWLGFSPWHVFSLLNSLKFLGSQVWVRLVNHLSLSCWVVSSRFVPILVAHPIHKPNYPDENCSLTDYIPEITLLLS